MKENICHYMMTLQNIFTSTTDPK